MKRKNKKKKKLKNFPFNDNPLIKKDEPTLSMIKNLEWKYIIRFKKKKIIFF
jgi:hypothetical protein